MEKSSSVKYLKNLRTVLKNLMGETILGVKYVRALNIAIDVLDGYHAELITDIYSVNAINKDEGIIIDIFHNETGSLLESIEMDPDSVIDESITGET